MHLSPDESTFPDEFLCPEFTGNADCVDPDDIFVTKSRRDLWVSGFPVMERPSDEFANYFAW